jgi:hypothetical protein
MTVARPTSWWQAPHERPALMPVDRVTDALGWLSLGLGLAEVLAPRLLTQALGGSNPTLVRSYGVREIAAGMGLLAGRRPRFWLWARVIGDAFDIASLLGTLRRANPHRRTAMTALGSVVFVTLLDIYCAQIYGEAAEDHAWRW